MTETTYRIGSVSSGSAGHGFTAGDLVRMHEEIARPSLGLRTTVLLWCRSCDAEYVGNSPRCPMCWNYMMDVHAEIARLAATFDPVKWLVASIAVASAPPGYDLRTWKDT